MTTAFCTEKRELNIHKIRIKAVYLIFIIGNDQIYYPYKTIK